MFKELPMYYIDYVHCEIVSTPPESEPNAIAYRKLDKAKADLVEHLENKILAAEDMVDIQECNYDYFYADFGARKIRYRISKTKPKLESPRKFATFKEAHTALLQYIERDYQKAKDISEQEVRKHPFHYKG
jgi:hypothetical protein